MNIIVIEKIMNALFDFFAHIIGRTEIAECDCGYRFRLKKKEVKKIKEKKVLSMGITGTLFELKYKNIECPGCSKKHEVLASSLL